MKKLYVKQILFLFLLSVIFFSCKNDDDFLSNPQQPTEKFTVISHDEYDLNDVYDNLMFMEDVDGAYDYHDLVNELVNNAPTNIVYPIAHDKVQYTSVDNEGNSIQLTGLFIYPFKLDGEVIDVPLISYNHGTELLKKYAPSKWMGAQWHPKQWGNFAEVLVANVLAITRGWAIIMPDYQGMGDDVGENHPYCIRELLAASVADMLETGINTIKDHNHDYVNWEGNAFVYGYFEGGYVTMTATRELEKRNVALTGSICMEGPYDLSGAMRNIMLKDTAFPVPYFLPLMLVGYNTVYPDVFDYNVVLKDPYLTNIPKYTNGFYDESVVDSIMPESHILKDVFTNAFIDSLNNTSLSAVKTLYNNNSYTWTPVTDIYLWHCENDDCVTFQNFVTAKSYFQSQGVTNITYVDYPPIVKWASTVHVSAAPIAFLEGSIWIENKLKNKQRKHPLVPYYLINVTLPLAPVLPSPLSVPFQIVPSSNTASMRQI